MFNPGWTHTHTPPCMPPHAALHRRTGTVRHTCTCKHNNYTPSCIHTPNAHNHVLYICTQNTHMHSLSQMLAAGMAMCTNTPTFSHPLNLCTQKPRATTSLSAVKPRNYVKPLSVFILPLLTMHYLHHLPCSHLPSNLGWSHFWVTWLKTGTCCHTITQPCHVLYLLLCVLSQVLTEKVIVRVCNHANQCVFTIYNQLWLYKVFET